MTRQSERKRIRLGITMGDPTGIGPEIILKVLISDLIPSDTELIIFGNPYLLKDQGSFLGVPVVFSGTKAQQKLLIRDISYNLVDPTDWKDNLILPGRPDSSLARGILRCIDSAVMWALDGKLHGVVTAPLSKEIIRRGGFQGFSGHTEYLAQLTGAKRPVMMLTTDKLKVVLATMHKPFQEIIPSLTDELLISTIYQTHNWFVDFFDFNPQIALAALNPHAGEGGTLGKEENTLLNQVIKTVQKDGITVDGPFPADTIFRRALQGEWDVVIALYHDQGMIPIKLDPHSVAVNVTLGLPIIRTSVDHGTAFDIAGQGTADPASLLKAIQYARKLILTRE
ncbi:4-hydroxythreonine-4-phosphate dehydrogenase PdxA [candidate division CSSED10-310 bacterium]|uniref:4-hydroxythreonine-4-phosphate dehydrogenase PdxA n=1 Tax=candidate division CSSED10-310 bacterium TaxID=2855610 RepID=A0ABV6Z2Y9_UNCC1